MPQLDIGTYASQLFWLVCCFGVLYIFMSRISVPLIATVLEKRQLHIEGTLKRGIDLQTKAESLRNEFDEVLTNSRQQAHQMLVSAVHDIGVTRSEEHTSELK